MFLAVSGKMLPENYPLEICPQENCHQKIAPRKIVLLDFTILHLLIFKLFIVTSFRGVSKNPAVSIIDLLVSIVNGSD